MFRSGKHRHFQDRRNWPDEKLKELYKQSGTDRGMKVAITRELNARAGKTPLHSPQAKRQRTLQWTMMNLKNTKGLVNRARYQLAALRFELSIAEADKVTALFLPMQDVMLAIDRLDKMVTKSFPPKAKKKEKENA